MMRIFDCFRYNKVLFSIDAADLDILPDAPGVYVISEGTSLYCGQGLNLRTRGPQSIKEKEFGERVFFLPIGSSCLSDIPIEEQVKALEDLCISALHTIIWSNGLPFDLTNDRGVKILPYSAWTTDIAKDCALCIAIAQTVLYSLGLPRFMIELPFRQVALSGIGTTIAAENRSRWPEIFAAEQEARKEPDHPGSPMFVLHPRSGKK